MHEILTKKDKLAEKCKLKKEPDDDAERFLEEETPVVEMAQELDLSAKCSKMEVKIKELEEALQAKIATESEPEPQEKANTDDASEEANSQKIQE
jgi:hypothetical protein